MLRAGCVILAPSRVSLWCVARRRSCVRRLCGAFHVVVDRCVRLSGTLAGRNGPLSPQSTPLRAGVVIGSAAAPGGEARARPSRQPTRSRARAVGRVPTNRGVRHGHDLLARSGQPVARVAPALRAYLHRRHGDPGAREGSLPGQGMGCRGSCAPRLSSSARLAGASDCRAPHYRTRAIRKSPKLALEADLQ